MEYKVETSLERFPAWSGGKDTLETLIEKGDCDSVERLIEEIYADKGETPTETEINDFLWFERDFIAEHLGFRSWDEYEYGEDEEEVEDYDSMDDEEMDLVYIND